MTRPEREFIRWGKLLFERRLVSGWGGNLSRRLRKNQILITGQHAALGFLTAKDIVRVNGQGQAIKNTQRASSETPMHLAVYNGTDAQAIIHAHPPKVVAFSFTHEKFVPLSFEEKFTLGDVPIISQDTPTVTKPEALVDELKYRPVVIIKGHGTVAIGKDLQEAFLLTDALEEAIGCQFFEERKSPVDDLKKHPAALARASSVDGERYRLFSREHMEALVKSANADPQFRRCASETKLTTSLTLHLEESNTCWTVTFGTGEIISLEQQNGGEFLISGKRQWWEAVFTNRIDAFLATQQGKLKLRRGELSKLSQWYRAFERAFSLWQTIAIQ
jgi:L-fuculose-phosphate aldolase